MNREQWFGACFPRLARVFVAALLAAPLLAQQGQDARLITLRQAVQIALRQNADVVLAQIEQEQAEQAVEQAKAPFSPRIIAGSGLAYTSGIPQSVEGATPSVVRVVGQQFLYDRKQSNLVNKARELANAAQHMSAGKRDEVAYRVASTYLDFEQAWQRVKLLEEQLGNLARIEDTTAARVGEGRVIALELSRARLERARVEQQLESQRGHAEVLEATLRHELRLTPGERLRPSPTNVAASLPLPAGDAEVRAQTLEHSADLKQLDAQLKANDFEMRAERGALYPKIDLVAQYSLLARFNNYDQFFNRFQRHNTQIGMSFQVPLFAGKTVSARTGQVSLQARELRIRREATESQVGLEAQRLYQQVKQAEQIFKLARQEMDFARQALNVQLALFEEGRAALDDVERARVTESQAWSAYYDGQYAWQKAKLNLLRQTGALVAALQ